MVLFKIYRRPFPLFFLSLIFLRSFFFITAIYSLLGTRVACKFMHPLFFFLSSRSSFPARFGVKGRFSCVSKKAFGGLFVQNVFPVFSSGLQKTFYPFFLPQIFGFNYFASSTPQTQTAWPNAIFRPLHVFGRK